MLSIAAHLDSPDSDLCRSALQAKAWMQSRTERAEKWGRIEVGRRVELRRLSRAPFDEYSGILTRPYLLRNIARRLGDDRVWSASQLKDYGLCGFRYFAKRLLQLEEFEEPEAGFDAAQLGLINHGILEETYREFSKQALSIDAENQQTALQIFDKVAEDVLERAPESFAFRATATWQEEKQVLRNRLAALIRQDFSFDSPLRKFGEGRTVHELELAFHDVAIDLIEGYASAARPRLY